MIRAVIDTNILISAFFWGGLPRQIVAAGVKEEYTPIVTQALIDELKRVLNYDKFQKELAKRNLSIDTLVAEYQDVAETVDDVEIPEDVIRDPKDRIVLGCAVGGKADYIVSGDKDLLVLGMYQNIPIVSAEAFLKHLTPAD
jgi:putative PIN family toxin of toxin-antitoxin system